MDPHGLRRRQQLSSGNSTASRSTRWKLHEAVRLGHGERTHAARLAGALAAAASQRHQRARNRSSAPASTSASRWKARRRSSADSPSACATTISSNRCPSNTCTAPTTITGTASSGGRTRRTRSTRSTPFRRSAASDFYWTLGRVRAHLQKTRRAGVLEVRLEHAMPNFSHYEVKRGPGAAARERRGVGADGRMPGVAADSRREPAGGPRRQHFPARRPADRHRTDCRVT